MNNNESTSYVFSEESNHEKRPASWVVSIVICFLISFAIWIYVANISTQDFEKTFSLIDIRIEGSELLAERSNMSVINIEESKVSVTVSGLRSDVSKLTADDFSAYIDVRDITEAGRHSLDVYIDLPESVSLVSRTPESVNVSVDMIKEAEVEVRVKLAAYNVDLAYKLGEPVCDVEYITVSGPQAVLERIKYATAYIDLGTVLSSTVMRTEVVLVDAQDNVVESPYITIANKSVTVTVPVTYEKNIPIAVAFASGASEDDYESVTLSQQLIKVVGDPKIVGELGSIIVYTLDGVSEGIFDVDPATIVLPEGVQVVNQETDIKVTAVLKTEQSIDPDTTDDLGDSNSATPTKS
jgi:YbbR domain-containing protein